MIHLLLVIGTLIVIYRVITRGPDDADARAAGIVTGLVFALAEAFAFIAGGWWIALALAIALWAAVNFYATIRKPRSKQAVLQSTELQ